MKINRTQDVHNVPDWVTAGTYLEAVEENERLLQAGIDRLNVTAASKVDEMCLFEECEQIEKCASNNQPYYYNSTWSERDVRHLKEFASVCGLGTDRIVGIDPTSVVERTASSEQMVKTASAEPQTSTMEEALKEVLGDPFHIDERTNMDHMKEANWQQVAPEAKLGDAPGVAMLGGICPIRGGEDYRIANQPSLAPNQNSIADPGAIERLEESETFTPGEKLVFDNFERSKKREREHQAWQEEKVAEMQADGFEAQGVVFPTEVGNVGSGVSSSFMGAYSEADLKNLPEKTAGESLAQQNETRKASIQRETKSENRTWEETKAAPSRMVSDHFTEELKKHLG